MPSAGRSSPPTWCCARGWPATRSASSGCKITSRRPLLPTSTRGASGSSTPCRRRRPASCSVSDGARVEADMTDPSFDILQPKDWAPPQGYANGIAAQGRQIFIAGQIGWNSRGELVSDDFAAQVEQALANVVAVLAEAGGSPQHLTRLTWYITDKQAYVSARKAIGDAYRRVIGRH